MVFYFKSIFFYAGWVSRQKFSMAIIFNYSDNPMIMFIFKLLVSFNKFASVIYKLLLRHHFRHNLTSDLIVALTLGVVT